MDPHALLPALATAGVLGVLHGLEPDHAAGIASLTGEAEDRRLSALLGACFAVGHVALVVAWVLIAYAVVGLTGVPEAFDLVGTTVVGLLLVGLSAALGIAGARRVVHAHRHRHGVEGPAHVHLHAHGPAWLPPLDVSPSHDHDHSVRTFLTVGLVGALFTLSPPLSMIAFISVIVPTSPIAGVLLALGAYAVAIVGTMAVIGGGIGTAFGVLRSRGERFHGASEILAAVVVFAFGINLLWQQFL